MSDSPRPEDDRLIGLALAIGRRGLGLTWPNPSVGAVLASPESGAILALGATQPGGRPHAERVALARAGEASRGATLYVSLEPCSHHGRTPPCTEAILAAGVARVVTTIVDPDDRVADRGHALLREGGLAVTTGLRAEEARRAHRGHLTRVRLGRPYVTLKLARTPDGYAAGATPVRLMITGGAANARTHLARARADAVIIGIETVLADDPRLDVRLPGLEARRPVRVVLDSRLRLPETARLVRTAREGPVWVVCAAGADPERAAALAAHGVEVMAVAPDAQGRVDLAEALRRLGERGLTSVYCEGGPVLADALAAADLVDEVVLVTGAAPLGQVGRPAVGPSLGRALAERFGPAAQEAVGADTVATYRMREPCSQVS